ncbi:MAG: sigma-70 family RNA polymerase sigma factor [Phycisphaerae bacterium]|nr:sigma-70 family RNA polymerase sigma factor [Phycisphaerae bacterium]
MVINITTMLKYKVMKHFKQAVKNWPMIKWDFEQFNEHVKDAEPKFPEDMYLAGAAGYRIDQAWIVIEQDLGPNVRRILVRHPKADMTVEDIWSETLIKIMSDDKKRETLESGKHPAVIIRYRGLVLLLNYLIVIARRVAIERNRKTQPIVSIDNNNSDERNSQLDIPDTKSNDIPMETEAISNIVTEAITKACKELSLEQQYLLTMVYRQGMKQKQAGDLLGWNESKTSRQLKRTTETLFNAIRQLEDIDNIQDIISVWPSIWEKHWASA